MHIVWALLLLTLESAPGCSCLPTNGNSIQNTVDSLIYIAQTTLVHIKELRTNLPVATHIEVRTPSIDGLTSISRDLGLLTIELQNLFTELLSQIQADVSSLEGLVRYFAQTMGCPIQARPRGTATVHLFPDSQISMTLMKVQCYLDTLLLHKDKLKVC
ncbi:leptin b [Labrus bergylta]|uniref:Leptin-B-like n=1 Tax=Labrus bergylta TaxID=56723 RepID=A0A3Q3FDQ7_9LABR|nr:leptin-B-like [Labrus bergylta]